MYRSILVPLDGSLFGESALPLAAAIARRVGAELQLVHVHEPGADRLLTFSTLDPVVEQAERAYLQSVAQRLAVLPGLTVVPLLFSGPVAEALEAHALTGGVGLLVIATHGHGPLSRFWLGSVADEMVRCAPIPVLLVRPVEAAPALEVEPRVRRVLIPLDGSLLAEQILGPALALGGLMGADYILLRVVQPVSVLGYDLRGYPTGGAGPAGQRALEEQARDYLEGVAGRLRSSGRVVQTRVVTHTHVAAAIIDEARAGGTDLIALASHGRGGLKRLLLGSVADKVLRAVSLPVLVWRPVAQTLAGA